MKTSALALKAAHFALEKGAQSVQILDVRGKVDYADMLVLCSGTSLRHVLTVAESIEDGLRRLRVRAACSEGMRGSPWVLLDYVDVIVHVFLDETRNYYDIEGLWLDAPRIPVPESEAPSPSPPRRTSRRPAHRN